ncbi:MAG: hypothetical protein AAFU72_01925 [Pseudomonadota bacterium]
MSKGYEGFVGSAVGLQGVPVHPGPQSVVFHADGAVVGNGAAGQQEGPVKAAVFSLAASFGCPRDGWEAAKTFGPATVEPVRFIAAALVLAFGGTEVLMLCLS